MDKNTGSLSYSCRLYLIYLNVCFKRKWKKLFKWVSWENPHDYKSTKLSGVHCFLWSSWFFTGCDLRDDKISSCLRHEQLYSLHQFSPPLIVLFLQTEQMLEQRLCTQWPKTLRGLSLSYSETKFVLFLLNELMSLTLYNSCSCFEVLPQTHLPSQHPITSKAWFLQDSLTF